MAVEQVEDFIYSTAMIHADQIIEIAEFPFSRHNRHHNVTVNWIKHAIADPPLDNPRATIGQLLEFWSGSRCLPIGKVLVVNINRGGDKLPIAHTCAALLDIRDNYNSYADLHRDFWMAVTCSSDGFDFV